MYRIKQVKLGGFIRQQDPRMRTMSSAKGNTNCRRVCVLLCVGDVWCCSKCYCSSRKKKWWKFTHGVFVDDVRSTQDGLGRLTKRSVCVAWQRQIDILSKSDRLRLSLDEMMLWYLHESYRGERKLCGWLRWSFLASTKFAAEKRAVKWSVWLESLVQNPTWQPRIFLMTSSILWKWFWTLSPVLVHRLRIIL